MIEMKGSQRTGFEKDGMDFHQGGKQ